MQEYIINFFVVLPKFIMMCVVHEHMPVKPHMICRVDVMCWWSWLQPGARFELLQ